MKLNGHSFLFTVLSILALCIIFLIVFSLLLIFSSGGTGDWSYNDLPNNYAIVRFNSNDINFGIESGENDYQKIVDRYIVAFCYNSQYICLQRINMDLIPYDEHIDLEHYSESDFEYYIVDSISGTVDGPLSKTEFVNSLNLIPTTAMCDWIKTMPKPKNAK